MKKLLTTTAILLAVGATGVKAQTADCSTNAAGDTYCDPTSFHVTSPTATGSDPVLLNDSNSFTITQVGNQTIDKPIRVLFVEPLGTALNITGASGIGAGGVAFSFGSTAVGTQLAWDATTHLFDGPAVTLSAGQDLVKQVGFTGGAASISYTNIAAEYGLLGLAVPKTFQVFDALFPVGFNSDADFMTVTGNFGLGTVIAPLALDLEIGNNGKLKITTYDTSWTNAGVVNTLSSPVPEPSTWAMGLVGFAMMGAIGWATRRKATSRYAFEA